MEQPQATIRIFGPPPEPTAAHEPGSREGPGRARGAGAPAWVAAVEHQHARLLIPATVAVALLSATGLFPRPLELGLLVTSVCLLGLPHGALDYLPGRELFRPRFGALWLIPFGTLYLSLSALVVVGWLLAPTASLVAFFLIAAGHFGVGDVRRGLALGANSPFARSGFVAEAAARGGLVIVALLFAQPAEVSDLIAQVLSASPSAVETIVARIGPRLAVFNGALLAVVLAHHLGGWAAGSSAHGRLALEVLALVLLFCLAPPLIAFVVYFCLWHSFRHSVRLAARLNSSSARRAFAAFASHAWPTTLGATALGIAGYWLMRDVSTESAIIRAVFVGLSALTAPHIIFCALAERGSGRVAS